MIRNIGKYFLFFFFFVFTLSLVNISPLFAKKEKEADKTAVDTAVCKRDATKTGAEQYSETCKTQCTSKETKFSQFQKENKAICDLFPPLSAIDSNANTKEQEIESLVQDVVEKLNKIEDTAENTAALEAIIPDFPSPTSKEFTITFSDKLRIVLEAIIFPQSVPESTATIAFVLNEATTTPETPEKTPGTTPETAEKTPIQARAEAAIKTIILKSFDPLTDTATGKYYKEVIQELRDHWLNVDLKGDYKAKDTPFTVDNFKSAIFGSIGYSLPHELYHFEFDEALTKAIKDHAEADTAKKAFVEAYKKYIETNTKIEIQSNSWEEGKSLEFKISLNAGDALLDPGIKCTDVKFAQFQKDNAEACKLVADATAKAANQEVCKLVANKTGLDQYSETCRTQCISTDATFAQFQADNADICKLIAVAAKAANQEVCKLVANKTGLDQYSETCRTQCISTDATFAQFQADNADICKLIAVAAKAANQEVCKLVANKTGLDQYSEPCKTQCTSTDATFAQFKADNTDACKVIEIANATAAENAKTAKDERGKAEAEKTTAEAKRDEAKKADNSANAYAAAKLSKEAADRADTAATNAEAAAREVPSDTTAQEDAQAARTAATDARTASNEAALAVIAKAKTEAAAEKGKAEREKDRVDNASNPARTLTAAKDADRAATKAETAAINAEAALLLIPDGDAKKTAGVTAGEARTLATDARTVSNQVAEAAINKAKGEAEKEKNTAVSKSTEAKNATTSTAALPFAKDSNKAAISAESHLAKSADAVKAPLRLELILKFIPTDAPNYAAANQAKLDTEKAAEDARTASNEALEAVITKANTEATKARNDAIAATDSTLALVEAQKADEAADRAEEARDRSTDINAQKTAGAVRTIANEAAVAVITKARGEATKAATAADAAQTSTLALPEATKAATAAKNAEAALNFIPRKDRATNDQTVTNIRTAANDAADAVINKAYNEAFNARDAAENADTSTLALGFAQTAAQAANNAEEALLLIPQGATNRNLDESDVSNIRTNANEAALAVINKAFNEAINARNSAENADNSTLALGFAQTAAQAANNAEAALLLIPAADRGTNTQTVTNIRTAANEAAGHVITKARNEAYGFGETAANEHTNVTNAAADRATALAAAGLARTAADQAATSATNAETALALIPQGSANRDLDENDAKNARNSANHADNYAKKAEAAVPN